jgi:alanine racemase
VSVGYADGYLRSLGNRGCAHVGDVALPVVGRVSMDTITLDVSALPDGALPMGSLVDLIGPNQTVDEVAARAGTIGYEILTSLGGRYCRRYIE